METITGLESKAETTIYADVGQLVARAWQLGWHHRGRADASVESGDEFIAKCGDAQDQMIKAALDPEGPYPYEVLADIWRKDSQDANS